jgi:enoyl-CoA hydratase/carnithine racemase
MSYKYISVERSGHLTIFTICRPGVLNALHPPANTEGHEAIDAFAADPDQWVGIVTGEGDRAFSAGNDLKYQATGADVFGEQPPTGLLGLSSRIDLNKPMIAAVNGLAMGGGFELALACDLVIAADSAVFALPEPKVGLAALGGGLHRLPRTIGVKRAMSMILTGRRVSAQEGLVLGFVNEVSPASELMETAKRWANQIIECSPMAIRAAKAAVYKGLDEPALASAMSGQFDDVAMQALLHSSDWQEGPNAFAQKRKPNWTSG